jgi:hypothetical protein
MIEDYHPKIFDPIRKIEEINNHLHESRPDLFEEKMPFWDDDKRTITNAIARSAVFSVAERGSREDYISYKVPAPSNYEITVIAGQSLTEADRDVYLHVMHISGDSNQTMLFPSISRTSWQVSSALMAQRAATGYGTLLEQWHRQLLTLS